MNIESSDNRMDHVDSEQNNMAVDTEPHIANGENDDATGNMEIGKHIILKSRQSTQPILCPLPHPSTE